MPAMDDLLASVYSLQQSAEAVSQHAPDAIAVGAATFGTAISTHASQLHASAWAESFNNTDLSRLKQYSRRAELQVAQSDWVDAFKSIGLGYYALPGNPNYIPLNDPDIEDLIEQPAADRPQQTPTPKTGTQQ